MPLPSVLLIWLPLICQVRFGASALLKATPVPPPIPFEATVLLAEMMLLLVMIVAVELPLTPTMMAVPAMFVSGLPGVPLLDTSKLAVAFPPTLTAMALVPIRFAALAPAMRLPLIKTTFDGSPSTPIVPLGPAALPLPPTTWMPAPLGKLLITLLRICAAVRLATVATDPRRLMLMPLPLELTIVVALLMVLLEMLALAMVPLPLRRCTPL